MNDKPILSIRVDIYSGNLNEAGDERLADAINDAYLEDGIFEFVLLALNERLPQNDDIDWFTLKVKPIVDERS